MVWAAWRAAGGIIAAMLLGALFAVTGGTETIYQDAVAAVMVVSALTLPLWLVVVNSLAAALAAASPWLYDGSVCALNLASGGAIFELRLPSGLEAGGPAIVAATSA